MMNQIQIWQLLVDIGLITSVLTLTTRAFKSSRLPGMLPKTRELEASLRGLIGDAEAAGLQLNDQLLRREQNIQKALTDMQESEARITRAIADAEMLQNKLQITRQETVRVIQDLKNGFERGIQSELGRVEETQVAPAQGMSQASQSVEPQRGTQPTRELRQELQQSAQTRAQFIEQSYQRTPLQREIEVSTNSQRVQQPSPTTHNEAPQPTSTTRPSDLQRIYQSAELLIKGGLDIESVASQMKLPVEGVKLLAQMIEIEREEDTRKQDPAGKFATTDSRLGALASIRRQTSVL